MWQGEGGKKEKKKKRTVLYARRTPPMAIGQGRYSPRGKERRKEEKKGRKEKIQKEGPQVGLKEIVLSKNERGTHFCHDTGELDRRKRKKKEKEEEVHRGKARPMRLRHPPGPGTE